MEEHQALAAFSALAQGTRLRILRMLVVAGPEGLAAGTIAEKAGVSASNVSFHVKELERAGIVSSRRDARSIIYAAEYTTLSGLIRFLMEDCCGGHPEICMPTVAAASCCSPVEEITQ
ncbi:MAG: ArsR/SmtB family transcription factor [Rhizobiaceae bacterium]